MDDNNVISFLDRAIKNIERGAFPIVKEDLENILHELVGKQVKNKGLRIGLLTIVQQLPGITFKELADLKIENEMKLKINEIARFINERYPN